MKTKKFNKKLEKEISRYVDCYRFVPTIQFDLNVGLFRVELDSVYYLKLRDVPALLSKQSDTAEQLASESKLELEAQALSSRIAVEKESPRTDPKIVYESTMKYEGLSSLDGKHTFSEYNQMYKMTSATWHPDDNPSKTEEVTDVDQLHYAEIVKGKHTFIRPSDPSIVYYLGEVTLVHEDVESAESVIEEVSVSPVEDVRA